MMMRISMLFRLDDRIRISTLARSRGSRISCDRFALALNGSSYTATRFGRCRNTPCLTSSMTSLRFMMELCHRSFAFVHLLSISQLQIQEAHTLLSTMLSCHKLLRIRAFLIFFSI